MGPSAEIAAGWQTIENHRRGNSLAIAINVPLNFDIAVLAVSAGTRKNSCGLHLAPHTILTAQVNELSTYQ
jgi:hypothetical protein